ncbi:hypothetical protein ACFL59_00570 [Planctomycetota bacterium]
MLLAAFQYLWRKELIDLEELKLDGVTANVRTLINKLETPVQVSLVVTGHLSNELNALRCSLGFTRLLLQLPLYLVGYLLRRALALFRQRRKPTN